jgi:osmotically-inducible protein OsmY
MSLKRVLPLLMALSVLTACAAVSCKDGPCSPDETLAETVKSRIDQRPALLGDQLRVQANNGVVYLYGIVVSQLELYEVEDVAKATPGVVRVVNMCAIENQTR